MQPSRMVYSHQACPDQLEHRASLLLICLTRLTNHPDIPKQQLPAITSSRTHVPISCTPISSLALDLGQISALGCSRARCFIQDPGNWMEHPLAAGQEGSPLPVLFCTHPLLLHRDGSSYLPRCLCWVGDLSQRQEHMCGAHRRAMSLPILHKLPGCQKV